MSKKQLSRKNAARPTRSRHSKLAVAITLVLVAIVSVSLLAQVNSRRKRKATSGEVSVASLSSPSKEYIYAGGRLVATEEPTGGGGCGTGPGMPGHLDATATSATIVALTWPASTGAVDHYQVERKQTVSDSGYQVVNPNVPPSTNPISVNDANSVSANTAYVYRVRAFDASACPSPYSNIDLATTVIFSSDPPVAIGSTIYAVHLTRMQTAVNAVRITAGLTPFDWGDSNAPVTVAPATGGTILKDQIQKLRNTLNQARLQLNLTAQLYTDEPLTVGTKVFANHVLELRHGVQ
jgi:hypothetical protein